MNMYTKKITLTSLLFCFASMANASWEPDVTLKLVSNIANINCGGASTNALFTVTNLEENNPILIYPADIINKDSFPDALVSVQPFDAPGSLTTCPLDGHTKLSGNPPHNTCNINLIITPASCTNGPIIGVIDRILEVGVSTLQVIATAKFSFEYTTLGGGDSFAILGAEVANKGSVSNVVGSIGHTDGSTPISGPFSVTNGQLYTSATDLNVINANNGFLAAYTQFIANKANCRIHTDISPPTELQASYYCLTSDSGLNEVSVDGPIVLSGNGVFAFFVDDGKNNCFPSPASSSAPCNLHIKSETTFIYKNGATKDRVYWITGHGANIQVESGAELDGTVLSGGNITTSPNGPSPASVIGHLWSLEAITLYGDSVAIFE